MTDPQVPDETLRQFLERRGRVLTQQIGTLRDLITAKERELTEIDLVGAALTPPLAIHEALLTGARVPSPPTVAPQSRSALDYDKMTIKEVVIRALHDDLQRATAAELRDFIKNSYGKVIDPSSLRPQLSRLKTEGSITQDTSTDTWQLTTQGQLMAIGHWPAGARMQQPQNEDYDLLEAASKLAWSDADEQATQSLQVTPPTDDQPAPKLHRRL